MSVRVRYFVCDASGDLWRFPIAAYTRFYRESWRVRDPAPPPGEELHIVEVVLDYERGRLAGVRRLQGHLLPLFGSGALDRRLDGERNVKLLDMAIKKVGATARERAEIDAEREALLRAGRWQPSPGMSIAAYESIIGRRRMRVVQLEAVMPDSSDEVDDAPKRPTRASLRLCPPV